MASGPSFVGFITEIQAGRSGDVVGKLAVESHADKLVTRHVVTVTTDTKILRRGPDAEEPVGFGAIGVKDWVEVWFVKATVKPDPPEVEARKIVIVPRP